MVDWTFADVRLGLVAHDQGAHLLTRDLAQSPGQPWGPLA